MLSLEWADRQGRKLEIAQAWYRADSPWQGEQAIRLCELVLLLFGSGKQIRRLVNRVR